jgi:uncharacterized protein (TIGR00369 family)
MELDPLQKRAKQLESLFASAPFGKTMGMKLSYTADFEAVFDLPHHRSLEHAMGDTHGGAIATLLDNAGWFTAAIHYENWIATVELQVRMLEPARKEDLRAKGRLVRAGTSLAVTEMEVRTTAGRLVAVGSGTFSRTSRPIPALRPSGISEG